MTRVLLVLILTSLVGVPWARADQDQSLQGWGKARFGMSIDHFYQAYPSQGCSGFISGGKAWEELHPTDPGGCVVPNVLVSDISGTLVPSFEVGKLISLTFVCACQTLGRVDGFDQHHPARKTDDG